MCTYTYVYGIYTINIHIIIKVLYLALMKLWSSSLLKAVWGEEKPCPKFCHVDSTNVSLVLHSGETVAFINLTLADDE